MTDWLRNLFHPHQKQQKRKHHHLKNIFFPSFSDIPPNQFSTKDQPQKKVSSDINHENNQNRDSDQDSLGYTQNDWDEETINFQLEDRMLDCLEEEKYANSYRQSLSLTSTLTRKSSKRFSKRPFLEEENNASKQPVQISIETILEQQYPEYRKTSSQQAESQKEEPHKAAQQSTQKTEQKPVQTNQQKPTQPPKQKPKRNRFSKYMKKPQHVETCQQQSSYFSPQLENKIDSVFRQKAKEILHQTNESCDEYIQRVFNLKLKSEEDKKNKQQKQGKKQNEDLEKEAQKVMVKKESTNSSQKSFEVVQESFSNRAVQISIDEIQSPTSVHLQNPSLNKQDNLQSIDKSDSNPEPSTVEQILEIKQNSSSVQPTQPKPQQKPIEPKSITNQQPKPYHILTPPKTFSENLPAEQKPLILTSNQILPQTNTETVSKKPSSFTIQTNPSPFPVKINFVSSQAITQFTPRSPILQAPKSPRAKIHFNYGPPKSTPEISQNATAQTVQTQQTSPFMISPFTKPQQEPEPKTKTRIQYTEPQPEERFPIFLRRLRRLNSCYPNLHFLKLDQQKINNDLKSILKAVQSAIYVIELLYKKLCIQKSKLYEPFAKIQHIKTLKSQDSEAKNQLEKEIMDTFLNSSWQSYKIQQIEYIKPKQRFLKRKLQTKKFQQAMDTYNKFIQHYLNEPPLAINSSDQIKRYFRIRQKISTIVQYLRIISEDLYTFWLVECNYPELYYDFLSFLKLQQGDNKQEYLAMCDEIYAKLLLAEEYKDPLSTSVVGRTIMEKIQAAHK